MFLGPTICADLSARDKNPRPITCATRPSLPLLQLNHSVPSFDSSDIHISATVAEARESVSA